MTHDRRVLDLILSRALSGKDSHVETATVLDGLDWKLAGAQPQGAPHTVFQLANHMIYWQEWLVKWLDGKRPRPPKHASGGWPGKASPANRQEWEKTVRQFRGVLDSMIHRSRQADLLFKSGKMTRVEMIHLVAAHNSYHAGQVAFLRQLLRSWPPPSGGVTW